MLNNSYIYHFLANPNYFSLDTEERKHRPYSPFRIPFKTNKVEYALARLDDLLNWARKVCL